jgi:Secretion system C-terminal sorting domain
MKPLLIAIIACCIIGTLNAQPLQYAPLPSRITSKSQNTNGFGLSKRTTNYYNSSGHLEGSLLENYLDGAWALISRDLVSPNTDGQPEQITTYGWTEFSWKENRRQYFTYDAAGNETNWEDHILNGPDWVFISRRTSTYQPDGQLLTRLEELGNWAQPFTYYGSEVINAYGTNNQIIDQRVRVFSNGSDQNQNHIVYTYDAQNRLASTSTEVKNGTNPWRNTDKREYTYDGNNRVSYVKVYEWNATNNSWRWPEVSDLRYEYYNDKTVLLLGTAAFPYVRQTTYFNDQQQQTRITRENWNNSAQSLVIDTEQNWTYTAEGAYDRYRYEQRINGQMTPQQDDQYEYDLFVDAPEAMPSLAVVKVYPNPTTDEVQVVFSDVEISGHSPAQLTVVDTKGQVMTAQQTTASNTTMSLRELPAGSYYLTILKDGQVQAQSIIKQ